MQFRVPSMPTRLNRLKRKPTDAARKPHRHARFFVKEIVDTTLPRSLRRDGWWLET